MRPSCSPSAGQSQDAPGGGIAYDCQKPPFGSAPMLTFVSREARLLLKISFLTTFAESMLVPMYSAFTEKVGGSILDAGIAFAAFSMATGALITLIGTRPWFHLHVRTCLMIGFL